MDASFPPRPDAEVQLIPNYKVFGVVMWMAGFATGMIIGIGWF